MALGVNLGLFGQGTPNQYNNLSQSSGWTPQGAQQDVNRVSDLIAGAAYGAPQQTSQQYDTTPVSQSNIDAINNYGQGGTTSSTPDYSQQISQYQNAINTLLPTQLSAGNQGIDNQYQSALQQLLQGKNIADRDYGTAKQQSATGFVKAKNTIGAQAGSSLSGLLRLLGARGAGASSASGLARQAVARGAGLQRGDVSDTFGANNQSLDTSYGDYNNNYNNQVTSVGSQRQTAKDALANQISSSKASLLQQIAALQSSPANAQPYLDQANAITQQVAGYVAPSINYNTQAYQAPTAQSYAVGQNATPTYNSGAGGTDYFSPYLQTLLGKKQQQFA